MRVIGITAEYNPFHNGHEHHILKTREAFGDCAVVAVMSGDFVQRGEAACFDKHIRAIAAVMGGADLVLELPLPWCIASAETFARGAIGLLGAIGVVDTISFGSECGNIQMLREAAAALLSPKIDSLIVEALSSGASYAAARQKALEKVLGAKAGVISSPNNILGIEYLKAVISLRHTIEAITVPRSGAGHDRVGEGSIRSASELRKIMDSGGLWQTFVPNEVSSAFSAEQAIDRERIETALLSRLRWLNAEAFQELPDASEGLENRLYKAVREGKTCEEILMLSKSKRYALSRLRRMLLCAALGVTAEMSSGVPGYARVLAANGVGLRLLGEMSEKSEIPIITKPAHGMRLKGAANDCFALTARARDFYTLGMISPEKRVNGSDWRTSPRIIQIIR